MRCSDECTKLLSRVPFISRIRKWQSSRQHREVSSILTRKGCLPPLAPGPWGAELSTIPKMYCGTALHKEDAICRELCHLDRRSPLECGGDAAALERALFQARMEIRP